MHTTTEYTLNMYGGDALGPAAAPDVRFTVYMYVEQRLRWYGETGGGVEKTTVKSGSLFALHTDTLSFISVDSTIILHE